MVKFIWDEKKNRDNIKKSNSVSVLSVRRRHERFILKWILPFRKILFVFAAVKPYLLCA